MSRTEFLACSLVFHAALLVMAVLLPAPFQSSPRYAATDLTYVELRAEAARRVADSSERAVKGHELQYTVSNPAYVERLMVAVPSRLRLDMAPPVPSAHDASTGRTEPEETAPQPKRPAGETAASHPEPQPPEITAYAVPSGPVAGVRTGRRSVNLRHQKGWPMPGMVRVDVEMDGQGNGWRATADRQWIIISPRSGSGDGFLKVGVLASSLVEGYHEGVVRLSAAGKDAADGCEVAVSVMVLPEDPGRPELPHFSWDDYMDGDCKVCHLPAQLMPSPDFMQRPEFCGLCHNPAGMAAGKVPGPGGHPVMAAADSGGTRRPSGGTVSGGAYSDMMGTHLLGGDKVVCVTCHNVMYKPGDFGRTWELAAREDARTFRLAKGGWAGMGFLVPKVYAATGVVPMPERLSGLASLLVGPSEYVCDEAEGTVTFRVPPAEGAVLYVTLSNPYLRAPTVNSAMCFDCHVQNTHQGLDCLVCHTAHGTRNIRAVREEIRTPGGRRMPVVFRALAGEGSFADGVGKADGVCEACHPGGGPSVHGGVDRSGSDCTACHGHAIGFGVSRNGRAPR